MAFMAYAGISLSMYSNIIRGSYWGNTLEIIMSSPLSFPSFFVMTALWTYFTATLGILLYLLLGVFVFGAGIAITSTFWLIIPLLVLSCIAISGFGLMSGSMFLLADVKGNVEPISWAVGVLSGLVSGVVFPPEIFLTVAPPLYHLSRIIPHTYAIDAFRRTVLNGEGLSNPMVQQDFIMLALFAMILFPLGLYMFARGIRKAERTGKLARWGG
ncbi:MAG: hypothetical protein KAT70_03235 [Thermoplasmata archaeon]|nr:hypothetical protein [Thermoplasmata archaeon]